MVIDDGFMAIEDAMSRELRRTQYMAVKPNILLFFPDQYHPDWAGFHKEIPVKTPNLTKLASSGIRFTNAVCPSPLCAPSRACLASGRAYDRCGVSSNAVSYPLGQQTFYTLLRDSGYDVLGCGKFDLHKPDYTRGEDGKHLLPEWGFTDGIDNEGKIDGINAAVQGTPGPYLTYLRDKGFAQIHIDDFLKRQDSRQYGVFATPLTDEDYCDNWIGRNGLNLLRDACNERPWFLQVNFDGPHAPMDITADMKLWCAESQFKLPAGNKVINAKDHLEITRNYAAMIENIDRWLGQYLAYLENTNQLKNTLIVFSSDHGDMLGTKGKWGKCSPERASTGVPLVISGFGVSMKKSVNHNPQTTLDLAATFLELADIPIPNDWDSQSLVPILQGEMHSQRPHVTSELKQVNKKGGAIDWKMVFDGQYKLIKNRITEEWILWDLKKDPDEITNLAEEPSYQLIMEKLKKQIQGS